MEIIGLSMIIPLIDLINNNFEDSIYFDLFKDYNLDNLEFFFKENFLFIIIAFFILKNFVLVLNIFFQNIWGFSVRKRLMSKLLEKYMTQNFSNFLNQNSAELIRNINASSSLGNSLTYYVSIITDVLLFVSILIFATTFLDQGIFYFSLGVLGIFAIIILKYLNKKIKNWSQIQQVLSFKELQSLQENFGAFYEINARNTPQKFINKYSNFLEESKNNHIKINTTSQISRYFNEIIFLLLILLLTILPTTFSTSKLTMIAILGASFVRLIPIFNKLIFTFQKLALSKVPAKIAMREFDKYSNFKLDSRKYNFYKKIDKLHFKNISFYYKLNKFIFKNKSFLFKKNRVFGIHGPSGAGKTTLINIITGILSPESGTIEINNKKILDNFRLNVGFLAQNTFLLDDTIKKNIAFFENEKKINTKKINEIIKVLELKDFINSLPEGINTIVGEKGFRISGGQKQRLGLARVIYLNPDIFVLDEPSSMLDDENEQKIFANIIKKFKKNKIIILITHKKSLLKFCDQKIRL